MRDWEVPLLATADVRPRTNLTVYDSTMRRVLAGLSSLGLAVVGSQVAHSLAYRLVAPEADLRAHLLADTGHAYLRLAPLGLAVVSVVVVMALLAEARSVRTRVSASQPRLWVFAIVAPATFVCQEVFERLLHDGVFPLAVVTERTFVIGVALQLPFALLAWLVARLLLRTAALIVGYEEISCAWVLGVASRCWAGTPVSRWVRSPLAACAAGRAPPSFAG